MTARPIHGLIAALGLMMMPLIADAQPADKVARIGYLGTDPFTQTTEAFRRRLRQLGWIEGQNLAIEYRWAYDQSSQAAAQAAELARLGLDLIAVSATPYAEATRQATSTIPIVFCTHGDPVGTGHAASLAHPGGNITGISALVTELSAKSLELLTQAAPGGSRRVAVMWNPTLRSHEPALHAVEAVARRLGVQLHLVPVAAVEEFEAAFRSMTAARVDALLGLNSPLYRLHSLRLAQLALEHRLPSLFGWREHAQAGSLLSYGPELYEMFRRCAGYADKILRGAKPAELPVEQASTYELVINLETALALGITIPPALLVRADEVIE